MEEDEEAVDVDVGEPMAVMHAEVKTIGLETVREGVEERNGLGEVRIRVEIDRKRPGSRRADPKERVSQNL